MVNLLFIMFSPQEEKLIRKGDTLGLKALTYETTLSNDSLEISYEFSDKKLQCKAVLPDYPQSSISQSILVELNGCKFISTAC